MTCREKLAIEHPGMVDDQCSGGCSGCPSTYYYLPDPEYCEGGGIDECTKCWDREIPDTEPTKPSNQLNLHKLIDEAMEKKDREVSIFIMKDNMSVYVRPVGSNDPRWIVHEGDSWTKRWKYECSECHAFSDRPGCYCSYCGEKLRMPIEEDGVVSDSTKSFIKTPANKPEETEAKDDDASITGCDRS